jgi:hypothetical protein
MAEKSGPGTRRTDDKNLVWFGEIERKLENMQTRVENPTGARETPFGSEMDFKEHKPFSSVSVSCIALYLL